MKTINKQFIIAIILIIGLYISTVSSILAASDPTFDIDPKEPEQLSSITFTANFDNYDDIQEIFFLYNECTKDDICFIRQNESMTNLGEGKWKITITLEHDGSAYVQYWIEIKTNEGWNEFPVEPPYPKTYLNEIVNNGGSNGNTNGQNNNDTPGFEFIVMLVSIISIISILYMKKRY